MKKEHLLFLLAIAFYLSGFYTLIRRIDPFQYFFYITSWWSYIIFIDTVLFLKYKRFFVLNRSLFFAVVISSGYWCFFELMNLWLNNWSYVRLPREPVYRYLGYFLAFGTVVPAICLTEQSLGGAFRKVCVKPTHIPHYALYALTIGTAALILTVALPRYCFCLAWVFAIFLLDGLNYRWGFDSFGRDLEHGRMEKLLSWAIAGLICGFLWEFWNFWSLSKWVYTVPFFTKGKIFEMPLAGYLGFIAFGLETAAFTNLVKGIEVPGKRRWYHLVLAASLLCSIVSFPLIDSYSVRSFGSATAAARSCNR
ncbi:MAG TPA: hypothetical protein VMT62_16190 [Syntrophorhabdaceae bacterium]|nr:hypothetical protein [Syntrophorhabdaceae bacterium]